MVTVFPGQCPGIEEDALDIGEINTMLLEVESILAWVEYDLHEAKYMHSMHTVKFRRETPLASRTATPPAVHTGRLPG